MSNRWWLAIVVVIVAAAAAVALALTQTGGGGAKERPRSDEMTHSDYALLWQQTRVGEAKNVVLARWPTPPYQHYKDNLKDDCFEWSDEPVYLYNLCFINGVLRSKDLS